MALLQPSSLRRASCCSTSLTGFSGWYSLRPTVVSCRRQVLCCLVRPFSARRREPFAHVKHNRAPCLSSVRLLGVMPTGSCFAYSVIRVCSPYDLPYGFTCLCRHPIFWSEGSGGPFALIIHSAHSPCGSQPPTLPMAFSVTFLPRRCTSYIANCPYLYYPFLTTFASCTASVLGAPVF